MQFNAKKGPKETGIAIIKVIIAKGNLKIMDKNFNKLLDKYANLIVETGINIQKGQRLIINAPLDAKDLVERLTFHAYERGSKAVNILWNHEKTSALHLKYQSLEELSTVDQHLIDQRNFYVNEGSAYISIVSPSVNAFDDVDALKISTSRTALMNAFKNQRVYTMANKGQWCVCAASNLAWARQIFGLGGTDAEVTDKLWNTIFNASRVTLDTDPNKNWIKHNQYLHQNNKILNEFQFDYLHFTSELGTDCKVYLVKDHIWAGGFETAQTGVIFNPNIPSEESFTMPDKHKTEGIVYASKPLEYSGKIVDRFYVKFEKGKVVDFNAEVGNDVLESILKSDKNASSIGEIALIGYDTPISKMNILFSNTLYDENASCHMALGAAYPMNIKNGYNLSDEQKEEAGCNVSITHVDFMFGTKDMNITGYTKDGVAVKVFENGNFILEKL